MLFDIDGTIIRRAGEHHKLALIEGVRRATGLTTDMEGIATSGALDRDLIAQMLLRAGYSRRKIAAAAREIWAECQNAYHANCAPDLAPFLCPGVRDLLRSLKIRNATLALVTGNFSRIAWRKMELAGLREFFCTGAFAEDGRTRARLAKIAVLRARRQGFAHRNARVSLIGDHPNDIIAAKRNGFQAVGVATGFTPMDQLSSAGADIVVTDLRELALEKLL